MVGTVTFNYIKLTDNEIKAWEDDSLDFFINQKEESNVRRGNSLREKAKTFIAAVTIRYEAYYEQICRDMIKLLNDGFHKEGSLEAQVMKDAIYQLLEIRLKDEKDIEIAPLV